MCQRAILILTKISAINHFIVKVIFVFVSLGIVNKIK